MKIKTKRHSTFIDRYWLRRQRHQHQNSQSNISSYTRLNANSTLNIDQTHSNVEYSARTNTQTVNRNDVIAMQCLDVGNLLKIHEHRDYSRLQCDSVTEGTLSYAGSSIDLEWEHEYDAVNRQDQSNDWHSRSQDDLASNCSDENCSMSELSRNTSSSSKLNNNHNCQVANTKFINKKMTNRCPNRTELERCNSATRFTSNTNRLKSNASWSHISTPDSLEWDVHEDDNKLKSEEDLLDQETMELLHEIEFLKNRALNETGDNAPVSATQQEES